MARKSFSLQLTAAITDIATEEVKNAGVALVRKLATTTPKDTTSAARSWLIGKGAARSDKIDTDVVVGFLDAAVEAAKRDVEGYQFPQTLHVTNNQPYIDKLNNGSSQQHPGKFVEVAIAQVTNGQF